MKYLLLLAMSIVSVYNLHAQTSEEVVRWEFKVEKHPSTQDIYIVKAIAEPLDPQWHFWSVKPGDPDGYLIPTNIQIDNICAASIIEPLQFKGTEKVMKDAIFGNAKYFAGKVVFTIKIKGQAGQKVKGTASFQACNDNVCLRPASLPFQLLLQ